MVDIRAMYGHVQVYDQSGRFLFSADTEREAREELELHAEFEADPFL